MVLSQVVAIADGVALRASRSGYPAPRRCQSTVSLRLPLDYLAVLWCHTVHRLTCLNFSLLRLRIKLSLALTLVDDDIQYHPYIIHSSHPMELALNHDNFITTAVAKPNEHYYASTPIIFFEFATQIVWLWKDAEERGVIL